MDPIRLVKTSIPDDMSMKVTEILPRLKDGGAFVKFQHNAEVDPVAIEGMCIVCIVPEASLPAIAPITLSAALLVMVESNVFLRSTS